MLNKSAPTFWCWAGKITIRLPQSCSHTSPALNGASFINIGRVFSLFAKLTSSAVFTFWNMDPHASVPAMLRPFPGVPVVMFQNPPSNPSLRQLQTSQNESNTQNETWEVVPFDQAPSKYVSHLFWLDYSCDSCGNTPDWLSTFVFRSGESTYAGHSGQL